MIKVVFKTNLDHYKTNCFPENLPIPPRIGEKVLVSEVFMSYFEDKKLPIRLQVVDVTWTDKGVICELWYNEQDKLIAINRGAELF